MKTSLAFVACVLVGLFAAHASARTSCTAGVKTVGGISMRTFCGPAKATVHIGSKTVSFSQGQCTRTSGMWTINIGTVVLGITSKPKPEYFGITVGMTGKKATKDGTYSGGAIAIDHAGKGYPIRADTAKVTLTNGLTRGSFSGASLFSGPKVSGTFRCR